jgi:hypothetical protein
VQTEVGEIRNSVLHGQEYNESGYFGVVSHIPKFGDASKSPAGDTASPARDAASPSGDAVVSHWRCIISFRDAHAPHSHSHLPQETPHLPREMWSHLQIAGYVTLLIFRERKQLEPVVFAIMKINFDYRFLNQVEVLT